MALIVKQDPPSRFTLARTSKVRLVEIVEYEPCKWKPTGRSLYVDRDVPLGHLPGWDKGCEAGEMAIRRSLFDSIVKIVDQVMKTMPLDEEELDGLETD